MGEFSLTVVLYGTELEAINREVGRVRRHLHQRRRRSLHRNLQPAQCVLCCRARQLRPQSAPACTCSIPTTPTCRFCSRSTRAKRPTRSLEREYLAVLETDNATPYFLNLHNGEVAHTMIIGMTGSGQELPLNFLATNAQKYNPLTYIFDIGGSFQSLTEIFGGTYLNVGQESRDFRINPFCLEPTPENLQFLVFFLPGADRGQRQAISSSITTRSASSGKRSSACTPCPGAADALYLRQDHRGVEGTAPPLDKGGAVRIPLRQRRGHADILPLPDLQLRRLGRHARGAGAAAVLRPAPRSNEIADPARLATFKTFLLDEAGCSSRTRPSAITRDPAQKTWRKHNAAMILATQSIKELEESGMLAIVAESCPTKIFLANPEMNREVYARGVPPERHRA